MDINKVLIDKDISIRETIEILDKSAKRILLVVEKKKLIGVVTDGDIRRWILKNGDLSLKVQLIMNKSPKVLSESNLSCANELMSRYSIEAVPIVNSENEVVDIIFWQDSCNKSEEFSENSQVPVVIMAGGKGTRLQPYTNIIPKVLIPIGDIPIVERIINSFSNYGFTKYYLTVNYKKDIIKAYFNNADAYNITFVEEDKPLGTAGSLTLLKDTLKGSFFLTNCDILVQENYSKILKYHKKNKYKLTVIAALKKYIIPYGVFKLDDKGKIEELNEKPEWEFLVNTGMYLLEAELLNYIPQGENYHMTDLIAKCLELGEEVGIYPVGDKAWLDMGEFEAMENMIESLKL